MFQVVVLPPEESMRPFEELRRLHDPAFHRVAAHLTLLPPFEAQEKDLRRRFGALRLPAPFEVAFGPPAAAGSALCLPLAAGAAAMRALQDALAAGLLPVHAQAPLAEPAVRIGLFGADAEMELARRALATLPPPAPCLVREVTLLLEDVRGLWHAVRTRRLAKSATKATASPQRAQRTQRPRGKGRGTGQA